MINKCKLGQKIIFNEWKMLCMYSILLEIGAEQILTKNKNKNNVMLGGFYSSKIINNIFQMKYMK